MSRSANDQLKCDPAFYLFGWRAPLNTSTLYMHTQMSLLININTERVNNTPDHYITEFQRVLNQTNGLCLVSASVYIFSS